jgi:hypothetical protein
MVLQNIVNSSDEDLSLCVLVNICRFISASPWWAQLNSREQTTHKSLRVWSLHWLIPYWANQFCLCSFIIFTKIFKFVEFCVSVIMGVSVRAWLDALKRESHAESVRLDRYYEVVFCFVSNQNQSSKSASRCCNWISIWIFQYNRFHILSQRNNLFIR